MFFLNYFSVWSFSFFFVSTYVILFFSFLIYITPIVLSNTNINISCKSKNNFYIISGLELFMFFFTPLFVFLFLNIVFLSPNITAWFGHIVFCGFQTKMIYLISFFFYIQLLMFLGSSYFSSNEIYDFLISKFNMYYWIILLFLANSLFTIIFVIEVLSTLIFLLITTSIFSTTFFYKNINFDSKNFFQNNSPFTFIQSLLFFFWVSLISSLNLFVFLILFYNSLFTFDWFLVEHVFFYVINVSCIKELFTIGLSWFVIIFSIFLKCGIVPLFLWKPTFFKGLNFNILIFYIVFFYFFLFLFLINFLCVYFNSVFYYYSFIILLFTLVGLLSLFFILCEAFYLKIFFAISSILNSLLVILSLLGSHTSDFFFFL